MRKKVRGKGMKSCHLWWVARVNNRSAHERKKKQRTETGKRKDQLSPLFHLEAPWWPSFCGLLCDKHFHLHADLEAWHLLRESGIWFTGGKKRKSPLAAPIGPRLVNQPVLRVVKKMKCKPSPGKEREGGRGRERNKLNSENFFSGGLSYITSAFHAVT